MDYEYVLEMRDIVKTFPGVKALDHGAPRKRRVIKEKVMEDLRIGLVGTGGIGRTHIERINTKLQGARVTGCADVSIDFCSKVAEKYGIKAFESGEKMIADPSIDAVICATADPYHGRIICPVLLIISGT